MTTVPPIKKKRGRPKKNTSVTNVKKPKKKSKITDKSKKYSLLDTKVHVNQKIIDCVVVHLPINVKKFQKNEQFLDNEFLNYDPKIIEPLPYDPENNHNNLYENITKDEEEKKVEVIENKNNYNIHKNDKYINKKVKKILVEFEDFTKIKQWPFSTDIKCWWCCHNFDNTPCGIPIKYTQNTFYVYGCFCSFNCSLSYNFNSNVDKKWERAGLVRLLYNKTHNITNANLNYAPNRECLKDFGGYMTIDEFRKNEDVSYNINYPPMLSIIPQMEEIKIIKETNRENDFEEKLNLVSEKMKIKNREKNQKSLSIFLKAKVSKSKA